MVAESRRSTLESIERILGYLLEGSPLEGTIWKPDERVITLSTEVVDLCWRAVEHSLGYCRSLFLLY